MELTKGIGDLSEHRRIATLARDPVAADPYRVPPAPAFVLGGERIEARWSVTGRPFRVGGKRPSLVSLWGAYGPNHGMGNARKLRALQPIPHGPGRTRTCARRIMSPLL